MYAPGIPELAIILTILGVVLLLGAVPAILAFVVLSRIPPQFRKQEPGLAFLLLIPLFSLIWTFFVHPKVAESLKAYYDAQGPHAYGDCGGTIALWLCICSVCTIVPVLGSCLGLAALILLIVFYVQAFQLSAGIRKTG